ncbi:copper amine oxidase N-terminal domain-containing protein [Paenibacillus sp. MBLB4367]|uniref:copper amine oxidase N-terminal domain-containing protein n=1 Tax=Paenibacillus sp. MBLB4367 TaxID=3384767 RepID=UPI0039083452
MPLRKISESLGATVAWEQESKTVTATKDTTEIVYTVGHDYYTKNGKANPIVVTGHVKDGSTLVPLRLVGESLGATVGWEGSSKTITISSAGFR